MTINEIIKDIEKTMYDVKRSINEIYEMQVFSDKDCLAMLNDYLKLEIAYDDLISYLKQHTGEKI